MSDVAVIITNPKNNRKIKLYCSSPESLTMTIDTARKKGNTFKIVLPSGDAYDEHTINWALDTLFNMENV